MPLFLLFLGLKKEEATKNVSSGEVRKLRRNLRFFSPAQGSEQQKEAMKSTDDGNVWDFKPSSAFHHPLPAGSFPQHRREV
jgi:hypothetical protein